MGCKPIYGLKFDQASLDALDELNTNRKAGRALQYFLPISVSANLVTNTNIVDMTYSVSVSDDSYESAAKAIKLLPKVFRYRIYTKANVMMFQYMPPKSAQDRKLYQFWENISNGCKVADSLE